MQQPNHNNQNTANNGDDTSKKAAVNALIEWITESLTTPSQAANRSEQNLKHDASNIDVATVVPIMHN